MTGLYSEPLEVSMDNLKNILVLLLILLSVFLAGAAFGACPVAPGDWDYCSLCGPCGPGQGDCDTDANCVEGLTCEQDVGPDYGFAKGIDVCVGVPSSGDTTDSGDGTEPDPDTFGGGVDGSVDGGTTPVTGDCADGLYFVTHPDECQEDTTGDDPPPPPSGSSCAFPVGHPDYCFSCGPCTEGQGGCNRNYQCVTGLICDLTTNICVQP
jgi:hypothetical protein